MKRKKYFILLAIIIFFGSIILYNYNNHVERKVIEKGLKFDLVGEWIADGTQSKILLEIKEDGTEIYADDYSLPYELTLKNNGTYYIEFNNKNGKEKGTWKILNDYNQVLFTPDNYPNERNTWHCEIESNTKISQCLYAERFTKNGKE